MVEISGRVGPTKSLTRLAHGFQWTGPFGSHQAGRPISSPEHKIFFFLTIMGCKSKTNSHSIGFILYIVRFIDKSEIYLLLKKVKIISSADTLEIQRRNLLCKNILKGIVVPASTCVIQSSQISQNLAFRSMSNDYSSVSKTFVFCQYPNSKECTQTPVIIKSKRL